MRRSRRVTLWRPRPVRQRRLPQHSRTSGHRSRQSHGDPAASAKAHGDYQPRRPLREFPTATKRRTNRYDYCCENSEDFGGYSVAEAATSDNPATGKQRKARTMMQTERQMSSGTTMARMSRRDMLRGLAAGALALGAAGCAIPGFGSTATQVPSSGSSPLDYTGDTATVNGVAWSPDGRASPRPAATTPSCLQCQTGETLLTYKGHLKRYGMSAGRPMARASSRGAPTTPPRCGMRPPRSRFRPITDIPTMSTP